MQLLCGLPLLLVPLSSNNQVVFLSLSFCNWQPCYCFFIEFFHLRKKLVSWVPVGDSCTIQLSCYIFSFFPPIFFLLSSMCVAILVLSGIQIFKGKKMVYRISCLVMQVKSFFLSLSSSLFFYFILFYLFKVIIISCCIVIFYRIFACQQWIALKRYTSYGAISLMWKMVIWSKKFVICDLIFSYGHGLVSKLLKWQKTTLY